MIEETKEMRGMRMFMKIVEVVSIILVISGLVAPLFGASAQAVVMLYAFPVGYAWGYIVGKMIIKEWPWN